MTYEEFRSRFPPLWQDAAEGPEPDGQDELFARVMSAFQTPQTFGSAESGDSA